MHEDHQLVCEPPDDRAFAADVRSTVERLARRIPDEAELVAAVVEALRGRYPSMSIRSRDPIAPYASERATWYVHRDGRRGQVRPPGEPVRG